MNTLLLWVSLYCFCYVSMKRSMHMLQQNRYHIGRYMTWCKQQVQHASISLAVLFWSVPCIGIAILVDEGMMVGLLTLLLFVYSYVLFRADDQAHQIKPLVWTGRIRRLFLAFSVVEIIWFYGFFQIVPLSIFTALVCFQFFMPWILIILAHIVMMPIETYIRHRFVMDAKKTLQAFPHQLRIGITGSFGKTSVKNIMYYILSEQYYCFKTPKSYNNLMGITRSIREYLKAVHQVFICEMGADHVHEIEQLAAFVEPQIGIVSAVGPQHLQTFHSIENILHEKMQLIEHLPPNGVGIINMDNDYIRNYQIQNTCKVIRYGIHQLGADLRAYDLVSGPKGTTFKIHVDGQIMCFQTILLGEHNVLNILAGLAVGWHLGIPWSRMQEAVSRIPYIEHRLELNHQFPFTLIDNAYNSNPVSARLALSVLATMPGKHFLITPGFIDLGSVENEENRRFGEDIPSVAKEVILVGEKQTRFIHKGLLQAGMDKDKIHVVPNTKEAFALCMKLAKPEDTVLIENDLPDAFNH